MASRKRPVVTTDDVEAARSDLESALENSRDVRAKVQAGKLSAANIRPANLAVEEAEEAYWALVRALGELNVVAASEKLGADIEWGRRK